jgi:hypothetical protein
MIITHLICNLTSSCLIRIPFHALFALQADDTDNKTWLRYSVYDFKKVHLASIAACLCLSCCLCACLYFMHDFMHVCPPRLPYLMLLFLLPMTRIAGRARFLQQRELRVLRTQCKLHHYASDTTHRHNREVRRLIKEP